MWTVGIPSFPPNSVAMVTLENAAQCEAKRRSLCTQSEPYTAQSKKRFLYEPWGLGLFWLRRLRVLQAGAGWHLVLQAGTAHHSFMVIDLLFNPLVLSMLRQLAALPVYS